MRGTKARALRTLAALEFAFQQQLPYQRYADLAPIYIGRRLLQARRKGALALRNHDDSAQSIYKAMKRKYVQSNSANRRSERLSSPSGLVRSVRDANERASA
jgi:hypothetical protein